MVTKNVTINVGVDIYKKYLEGRAVPRIFEGGIQYSMALKKMEKYHFI